MDNKDLKKLFSMIIQDLRKSENSYIINLIKDSKYSLEFENSANWNGRIDYYAMIFQIDFDVYRKIRAEKNKIEKVLMGIINEIHFSDYIVITNVDIKTELKQFIDWKAIEPEFTKTSIITMLKEEEKILKDTATGTPIKDSNINNDYITLHNKLNHLLNKLCLEHHNKFKNLWDWYNYYKENLPTYNDRRKYVDSLYSDIYHDIENSNYEENRLIVYTPTGWDKVDETIYKMRDNLSKSIITEDYQSIGMYGREVLKSLAQIVFDESKHKSEENKKIGKDDAKSMLEAFIVYNMKLNKRDSREINYVKSSIDFSNHLTHDRASTLMDAELCYTAVVSTINIVRTIYKYNN